MDESARVSEQQLRGAFVAAGNEIRPPCGHLAYRFRNMVEPPGGAGVDARAVAAMAPALARAERALERIRTEGRAEGHGEPVRFVLLPHVSDGHPNNEASLARLERWAEARRHRTDVALAFGIGGSYLGNRVLHEALLGPRWNLGTVEERRGFPPLELAGHHLDPLETRDLVASLRARQAALGRTCRIEAIAISKGGLTVEPLSQLQLVLDALGGAAALAPGEEQKAAAPERPFHVSLTVVSGPGSPLDRFARERGLLTFQVPDGIGGRFSVLSECGLITAALCGADVRGLLRGAAELDRDVRAAGADPSRNPALLYAALHHLGAELLGCRTAVMMPYCLRLKSLAEWYVQLLAESLGKARDRRGKPANAGRTPLVAVGTSDMHAQTQLHQEGPRDKTVTTIDLLDWGSGEPFVREVLAGAMPEGAAGRRASVLNRAAREANEEALARDGRLSDALLLRALDAPSLGALLHLLMLSVAYEAELLGVNAYDQPGVDAYKRIMRERLAAEKGGS